jgi:hypothetical protein
MNYETINRVLLAHLQQGNYTINYLSNNHFEIQIAQLTLYIDFKYTEADGHVDNDYFNGTGEFIESHPAKIDFSLIQIFKGEDDLEWHISTPVTKELESIIINYLQENH